MTGSEPDERRVLVKTHFAWRVVMVALLGTAIGPFWLVLRHDHVLVGCVVVAYLVLAALAFRIRVELTTRRLVVRGLVRTRTFPLEEVLSVRVRTTTAGYNSTTWHLDVAGTEATATTTVFGHASKEAADRIKKQVRAYKAALREGTVG